MGGGTKYNQSSCAERDEFLTGEPFLPSRTVNQYLARYWFAVPTVKMVHQSEIHHKSSPQRIEPQSGELMETGRATPGEH